MSMEAFNQAAIDVKNIDQKPTDDEMLKLYSLYKQVMFGDCNTDRPGMLDFSGKAKWDAWNARKGESKDGAMAEYITTVEDLKSKYGTK